jgi:hypothetical protein
VTRHAIKAAKKARQRDANYGHEKLLLTKTMLENQVALKKDPTDRMQLPTKSPPDGSQIKSSIAEAALQSSAAEASTKSSRKKEAALQSSAAETAIKISEETALKISEEATLKKETMSSNKKLAVNESLCTSSKVSKTFDDDPSQPEITKANTDMTTSQPEITEANIDVTPSQPEDTKANIDETPSQPEITKLDRSVTTNETKQATKYKEQQSSSCKTPGCSEQDKLQCPACIKHNFQLLLLPGLLQGELGPAQGPPQAHQEPDLHHLLGLLPDGQH